MNLISVNIKKSKLIFKMFKLEIVRKWSSPKHCWIQETHASQFHADFRKQFSSNLTKMEINAVFK